jgi:hypothetical protein
MAHQIRGFVLRLATNIHLYQLAMLGLGLALTAVIQGAPIGGGGGN